MDIEALLDQGDAVALQRAVSEDPSRIDAELGGGDHRPHPIHAVCDRVFDGRLSEAVGRSLVEVLVKAGAKLEHTHHRNGDGLVTSAISLSCPSIANFLIDAGAPTDRTGLFEVTPLFWAAIMGMPELVARLLDGAELTRRDREFDSTPLGWAIEGWAHPPKGSKGGQIDCAALLVAAGSIVEPQWVRSERIKADAGMKAALGLG